jgi:membrane-associated protein
MGTEQITEAILKYGPLVSYITLFSIIFAESGLLIGFFLPGDSLLFTAGFLASQGFMSIYVLTPLCFVAAVLGDSVGYAFGHKVGKKLFKKEDSILFHKDHLLRAKEFYEKHGGKTIILARFLPVVRTFAPIVAGIGDMKYSTFLFYNVIGGVLWAVGLTLTGFFLGSLIPDIDRYLLPIIGTIVLISVAPTMWHILKEPENRRRIHGFIKKTLKGSKS